MSHSLSVKKYFCSEISAGEQDTKKTKSQSLISQYSFKNALYPINVTHSAIAYQPVTLKSSSSRIFHFDQLVHAVNHKLDELDLRITESVLVGDIINGTRGVRMLSIETSDLQVVLLCPFF